MADDELLTPDVLAAYQRMRNVRRNAGMKRFAQDMGGSAEVMLSGDSRAFDKWGPQFDEGLTAAQKVAAMDKQAERQKEINKNRADGVLEQYKKELEGLKAILQARTTQYGTASANSRARANNALRALDSQLEELNNFERRLTQLDEPTQTMIQEFGRGLTAEAKKGGSAGGFFDWFEQEGPSSLMSAAGQQEVQRQFEARTGLPYNPALNESLLTAVKQGTVDELKEDFAGVALLQGKASPDLVNRTEATIDGILRDQSVSPAQKAHRIGIIAARLNVPPEALAAKFGVSDLGNLQAHVGEELKGIVNLKQNNIQDMLQAAKAVGADTSGIERAIADIHAARAAGPDLAAVERTAREGLQQRMADTPQGDLTDPATLRRRIRDAAGDPEMQSALMMEYIANYPDDPPAQQMRKGFESSGTFEKWKQKRGYAGGPQNMVWQEFERELKGKQKERQKRFQRQREMNQKMGLTPPAKPSETDEPPEDMTTQSGSDDLVAGATRQMERFNAPGSRK